MVDVADKLMPLGEIEVVSPTILRLILATPDCVVIPENQPAAVMVMFLITFPVILTPVWLPTCAINIGTYC